MEIQKGTPSVFLKKHAKSQIAADKVLIKDLIKIKQLNKKT